jgi:hypothetical protein
MPAQQPAERTRIGSKMQRAPAIVDAIVQSLHEAHAGLETSDRQRQRAQRAHMADGVQVCAAVVQERNHLGETALRRVVQRRELGLKARK